MVDIDLTCRLLLRSRNIKENSQAFTININTEDFIDDLKDKIYEKIKETNNDFLDIDSDDLRLWKVEISNDDNEKFSALVLLNDHTNNVIKLRGNVGDYWDDDKKSPKEGYIHVAVKSPRLIDRRENVEQILDKEEQLLDKDEQIVNKDEQILDLNERFRRIIAHFKKLGPYNPDDKDLDDINNLRNEASRLCYALVGNGALWESIVTDTGNNEIRKKNIDKRTLQKFCNGTTGKPMM